MREKKLREVGCAAVALVALVLALSGAVGEPCPVPGARPGSEIPDLPLRDADAPAAAVPDVLPVSVPLPEPLAGST